MEALSFECRTCGAKIGERCTNYLKKACAPHRGRGQEPTKPKKPKRQPKKWVPLDLFGQLE